MIKSKISFDTYVVDTLLRDLVGHDHSPSSFLVYVYIWMRAGGRERNRVTLSYQALAEATGLSKSATQIAIRRLVKRQLLTAKRDGPTATTQYAVLRPWKRLSKLLA